MEEKVAAGTVSSTTITIPLVAVVGAAQVLALVYPNVNVKRLMVAHGAGRSAVVIAKVLEAEVAEEVDNEMTTFTTMISIQESSAAEAEALGALARKWTSTNAKRRMAATTTSKINHAVTQSVVFFSEPKVKVEVQHQMIARITCSSVRTRDLEKLNKYVCKRSPSQSYHRIQNTYRSLIQYPA